MPFKSKAQMRAAFAGGLGPEMQAKAPEFARNTDNINQLPQRAAAHAKPQAIKSRLRRLKLT
jgi:hypothetical protein